MDNYEIIVVSNDDREYIHQCLQIIKKNEKNTKLDMFGQIDVLEMSKYIICAVENNRVIGFVSLMENILQPKDIFISQIAILTEYQNNNISERLINYLKQHSLEYDKITTNIPQNQYKTIRFYQKLGFEKTESIFDGYKLEIDTKEIVNNNAIYYTDLDDYFE